MTETEPGRRNRRTVDSLFLFVAAIVIGLSAVIAASAPGQDRDVAHALTTVLGWAGALWGTAFFGVLALAIVLVCDVLLRRRWDLVRDLLVAASGVVGAAVVLGRIVESDWLPIKVHLLARWGYPDVRLAAATAVIVVVGPELVRNVRVLATWLVPFASLGAVVLGATLPSGALAGLALGLGAGCDRAPRVRNSGGRAAGCAGARRLALSRDRTARPETLGADALLATLTYRLVSYWLPIPAGGVAYVAFRRRYP